MLKHNDFDCGLIGLRLLANGGVSSVGNLNNSVCRAARPELGGVAPVVRRLDIDLKSSDLCCFYEHQLAFTVTRPSR
jgi:hypothetical protein